MEKSNKCSKLLPYHIIAAAASGDVEAINEGILQLCLQESSMMSAGIRITVLMKLCVAD